tara:strand:- start:16168 stop:16557 length:390 start_codon:yes stop_codon:yes gene_type:complete
MKIEHFCTESENGIRLLHFKINVSKDVLRLIDWEIYCDDNYTIGTIENPNYNILTVEVKDNSIVFIRIKSLDKPFFKFVNIEKESHIKHIIPVENITMELEEVQDVSEITKKLEIITHNSSSDEDDSEN